LATRVVLELGLGLPAARDSGDKVIARAVEGGDDREKGLFKMRRTRRSLIGNGFLAVPGKVPLAVAYKIDVFAEKPDGSIAGSESATGTVSPMERGDLSEYIGERATLQLEDGFLWDCVVVNENGRLENRVDGPIPPAMQAG
jgi:hypothetical protein